MYRYTVYIIYTQTCYPYSNTWYLIPSFFVFALQNLLTHGASCSTRAQGGCGVCKRIWALLQIHARQCKKDMWVHFFFLEGKKKKEKKFCVFFFGCFFLFFFFSLILLFSVFLKKHMVNSFLRMVTEYLYIPYIALNARRKNGFAAVEYLSTLYLYVTACSIVSSTRFVQLPCVLLLRSLSKRQGQQQ